jgi:hypothetical protein
MRTGGNGKKEKPKKSPHHLPLVKREEIEEVMKKAREETPFPDSVKPKPREGRDELGLMTSGNPGKQVPSSPWSHENHPAVVGIRRAKLAISELLARSENLDKLKLALQTEFDEDPTRFLRLYEPLLRPYEERFGMTSEGERRPVRMLLRGVAAVEIPAASVDLEVESGETP